MAEKQSEKKARSSARRSTGKSKAFTDEERAAMRERVREMKAQARRGADGEDSERDVLEKIAEMPESDRVMAERFHAVVKAAAPTLSSRTWYGMPAYAKDGRVVCFFQSGQKFKARYATIGFSDKANIDKGAMWPTSYALTELNPEVEARLVELLRRAVS